MFNIQFNFNPVTSKISNLTVTRLHLEDEDAIVSLDNNKLKFNAKALELLNVNVGDRIAVNYWTVNNEETFPVIGKSELFTDKEDGNKLTKSRTISFRGDQREILSDYGSMFKLEPFKDYFKMSPIKEDDLKAEENELNELE